MIKFTVKKLWEDRVSILIGGSILFVIVTWFMSLSAPFTAIEVTKQPVVVKPGGEINICMDVYYSNKTSIKISRHMLKWDDELKRYRSKQVSSISSTPRDSGDLSICRVVTIPDKISLGHWTLWTHVEITSFPWWTRTFKVLPLAVEVVREHKL